MPKPSRGRSAFHAWARTCGTWSRRRTLSALVAIPLSFVGVWWSLHLDTQTWGTGPKHGATTENTKRYIDFAAKHGFRGVLVEGWNVGWDGDWFANGWNFDFSKPTPDYDLEELAAYAKSKGVHLIGHHETACAVSLRR